MLYCFKMATSEAIQVFALDHSLGCKSSIEWHRKADKFKK